MGTTKNVAVRACKGCEKPIPAWRRKGSLYCSRQCGHAKRWTKVENAPLSQKLNTVKTGAIAEMLVAVDLLRRGYDVYRAVSASANADLVAILPDGRALGIQVRTGTEYGKKVYWSRKPNDKQDHYAVVLHHEPPEINYEPPLDQGV